MERCDTFDTDKQRLEAEVASLALEKTDLLVKLQAIESRVWSAETKLAERESAFR